MTAQFHCPITMINGACADVSTRFTRRDASIAECERIGTELYHRISDCTDLKKLDPALSLKHRIYQAATCVYPVSYTHLDVYKRQSQYQHSFQ